MAQDDFFFPVVHSRIELKLGEFLWIVNRPSRERPGDGNDIVLGIASIDAERVQFHQLAAVIFIEARPTHARRGG